MSYPNKDAQYVRKQLEKGGACIIGGVSGMEVIVTSVVDRLDELEWMVAKLKAQDDALEEPDQ